MLCNVELTEHSVKKGTKRQFIGMKLALDKDVSKKKKPKQQECAKTSMLKEI